MPEKPLYEDSQLLVDYLPNCIEDHFLLIKPDGNYIIPRGCLEDFARTSRDRLKSKMMTLHEFMVREAREKGLSVDSLGLAIAKAYIEEERRRETLRREMEAEDRSKDWF